MTGRSRISRISAAAGLVILAGLVLTGCAGPGESSPATTTATAPPAETAPATTGSVEPSTPSSSPTPVAEVSAKQKAYEACAAYAASHNGGTLKKYNPADEIITTNQGSPALDLPITTPEGTPALYLCVLPGYPDSFTVSEAGPHDAG